MVLPWHSGIHNLFNSSALEVQAHYKCLFGVSDYVHGSDINTDFVSGKGFSHMIVTAPRGRVYFLVTEKIETGVTRGVDIPRYTLEGRALLCAAALERPNHPKGYFRKHI